MADVARLIDTLRPMREPATPVSITPLLVMALAGCAVAAAILVLAWQARRRGSALRRAAEAALAASRQLGPGERLAAQAALLRRFVRSRDEHAARTQGRAWLESLDRIFATRFFTEGEGAAYGEALYGRQPSVDVDKLDHSLLDLFSKVHA